jgi:energy-converting hydrogenase Eha subunit A
MAASWMTPARHSPRTPSQIRTVTRLALAALVFHLVLVQPNHPAAMTWAALAVFPLELPVILLGLIAIPKARWSVIARGVLVAVLVLIALLKAADFAMFTALARGFNPVADLSLIEAGLRLTIGAMGLVPTIAAALAALGLAAAVSWALWWASGVWARIEPPRHMSKAVIAASVLFAGVAVAEIGQAMGRWSLPLSPPGAAFTARVGVERVEMARATLADLRRFEAAALDDPFAERTDLLRGIDRDVLVVFVESYGRTSLDTPLYADTHRATLSAAETRLAALGLSMRSGLLGAPTRGGQSWLSHATFANGLWIADQTSYGAVLASGRRSLFHIASEAGFRTAAVMPQITLDWPESQRMGFGTVLAARDLGYAGQSFNWVTMPDQFTFAALDRLLREDDDDRPLFAQIALGSSHAPWVPVPMLVDWDEIGDGSIFDAMAASGDPPDVVWRDRDRVRDQYRQAIDYALNVVFDYAARHAENPPLIFVVGDHQAAGFVALDERPDVPVHVIGPRSLVDVTASWGWGEGLLPEDGTEVLSMAAMRDLILDTYSPPAGTGGDS